MQGLAAVVFKADGEPDKSKEDGEAIARIVVGLLRFFSPRCHEFSDGVRERIAWGRGCSEFESVGPWGRKVNLYAKDAFRRRPTGEFPKRRCANCDLALTR